MRPPIASVNPKITHIHGQERLDNYNWMRLSDDQKNAENPDKQTQEVIDYLNAENAYTDEQMKDTEDFQEVLFKEIVGRIKQTDMSVPFFRNGYHYISKFEEGKEYAIHTRKEKSIENADELLLDENILGADHEYYQLGGLFISEDNRFMAYSEDTISRRIYTIKVMDLKSGTLLTDVIKNTTGSCVWSDDGSYFFYSIKDDALRPYMIMRHKIGTPQSDDKEVYREEDETFRAFVYKTKSSKYIVVGSYATLSQEYHIIPADTPTAEPQVFQPRVRGLEYSIAHKDDKWYVRTNKDGAYNFKIMTTPVHILGSENWQEFIPHREDTFIEELDLFNNFMALEYRKDGLSQIDIIENNGHRSTIEFGEETYMASLGKNPEFDSDFVRVAFTSMITPISTYDYDVTTKELTLRKQQEVVGDFDSSRYNSERIMVTVRDGIKVPVSIVYKAGYKESAQKNLLLYAYGSYGHSIDPYFSSVRLSLLDRGFAFAIAHIRGGQEMGRKWYDEGKLLKKKNTFNDFIDCGKHLVAERYVSEDGLYAMGGSAGGLLMGVVYNEAPELWKGIIAAVPFVDVINTMLDEYIPLTTGEFDEWGNPKIKEFYDYIMSYSPYDNVEKKNYPSLLITTGYHDSQVQYWEPAKWLAKLRQFNTSQEKMMMHCNMEAGHGGKSGRFRRYKETALEYAYLLKLAGRIDS